MRRFTPASPILVLILLPVLMLACASDRQRAPERSRATISASDFADPTVSRTPDTPSEAQMISLEEASLGAGDVRVTLDPPTTQAPLPAPVDQEQRFLVDEMVGQINGKPVYANEFFTDMDARLRAEAQRLPLQEWINMVTRNVAAKLEGETRDELLLSEFQSSLTPEQRVGVLAFIEDLRKDIQRGYGGSSELANQQLQETEGVTLREKVESQAERQFIIAQLRGTIAQRVQVSYKDIELYYNQNIDKYQPAPDAVFRVIRIPLSKAGRVTEAQTRLDAGEDPVAVAAALSDWAPDEGNVHSVTLESRSLADTTVWGPPELDEPTRALEPGEFTSRVDIAKRAWWIYLEEIEQPEGKSLYEAQLEIEQEIRRIRISQEETRYWNSLVKRSNMTAFDEMIKRLVGYAAERYYVQRIYAGEDIEPTPSPEDGAGGMGSGGEAGDEPVGPSGSPGENDG